MTEERRSADGPLGKGLLVALEDHPDGAGVSQLAREVEVGGRKRAHGGSLRRRSRRGRRS